MTDRGPGQHAAAQGTSADLADIPTPLPPLRLVLPMALDHA